MSNPTNFHKAITMKGFPYIEYNGENIEEIRALCVPYKVMETKRFKTSKKITVELPKGTSAIDPGNIFLKMNDTNFLILTEEEFQELFFDA